MQINRIRNEKVEITANIKEMHKIIRDYEKLYTNKLDNLEEMDKFIETYNLPRLNQEEIDNQNRLISSSETEFRIKKKCPSKPKVRT